MRYHFNTSSLFIRGSFRAASTGVSGGIRSVSTLINHTVSAGWSHEDPKKELEFVAASAGISHDFFGLLTAVPVQQCCVLQYDSVTAIYYCRNSPGTAFKCRDYQYHSMQQ